MKRKGVKQDSSRTAISLKGVENAIVDSDVKVDGNFHIGNNYYGHAERFVPPVLPFERPLPHLTRQILKKQDADGLVPLLGGQNGYDLLEELSQHGTIVLLGDAGMGKSTELEWLCHELKDSGDWIPIFKSLGGKKYLADLPCIPKEVEDKIVLVLDGLDESNLQEAKTSIENFRTDHTNAKILISCRSNAYSNTLQNFEVYYLGKLAYLQIQQYTQEKLGHFSKTFLQYWRDKHHWNQSQLIDNPFFLVHICEYVKDKGDKMPDSLGEVFEHLIEKTFDSRLPVLSHFGDGDVSDTRKIYRQLLGKLAFVMECRGDNVISNEELAQLISDKNQRDELIGRSSLLELQENNWRFAHNNFQEYLAAKVLSNANNFDAIKKALSAGPDFRHLKWTWINTLSFLMDLWDNAEPKKKNLLDWLAENALEPLIKIGSFEPDKIPSTDREHIFKLAFEACKSEDLIVGSHHYNYWEMAKFGESPETIRYLTDELRVAKTPTVKGNALILLKGMKGRLLIGETRVLLRELLLESIYDYEGNTPANRHYAVEAFSHLFTDIKKEEAIKMVEMFFDSEHPLERTSAYGLIEKQNLQIQFMEHLIRRFHELDDYTWRKGEMHYVSEDLQMENCFEKMDSEDALICFFEKYPGTIENKWDGQKKPLNSMLEKLDRKDVSPSGIKRIFQAMKELFADWIGLPTGGDQDLVIKFIRKYNLEFSFFCHCIDTDAMWAAHPFFSKKGIDYLVKKYKEETYDRKWWENYQYWTGVYKKDLLPLLNWRLNEVAEEPFPLPFIQPAINHEQRRKEKSIEEKSFYFNIEKFISVVKDIFIKSEKNSFKRKEVFEVKRAIIKSEEDFYDRYPNAIIWFIDDHPLKTKEELVQIIRENWDWISINQVKKFLINNQREIEKIPELGLNKEEIGVVKNWCNIQIERIDWNGTYTYADVAFVWFVTHFHFTQYSEETYLQMVGSGLQNHGVSVNIIEFLKHYKPELSSKLKERVLENIRLEKAQGYELHLHFDFVRDHQLTEAIYDLRPYIEKQEDYSYNALRVYISLVGHDDFLLGLFKIVQPDPNVYLEQTLLDHFSAQGNEAFEKNLLQKLAASADSEQQMTYARYLLREDNLVGLQFLAGYIEREKKSPFSAHMGNRDYQFENPMGILVLLRFFDYGYDASIPQDIFDSLASIGRYMLLHLAACQGRRYFELVRNAIVEHLNWQTSLNQVTERQNEWLEIDRPEGIKQLRYLLKDLEFNHHQKQQTTIVEAVKVWEKLS